MKKILLAGTALAALAALAFGPAEASDKLRLQLGGYSKWWVVAAWNEGSFQAGQGVAYNNVDVKGDNEIHFKGDTTLDNGLKVGVVIEMEAGGHTDTTSDPIDASYAFVEGGFGRLLVGSQMNAAYLLHVAGPDAAGNIGSDGIVTGGFSVAQPAAVSSIGNSAGTQIRNLTAIYTDNKAEKITYISPTVAGFSAGASYIPNWAEDNRNPTSAQTQSLAAGALYSETLAGVGVKVSVGGMLYDAGNSDGIEGELSAGTQLSYAGYTLGGSVRQARQNLKGGASNAAATTQTTSNSGWAWDAGIQYAIGTWAVGLYYFGSETAGGINGNETIAGGKDRIDIAQVSAKYGLGPGVDVLSTVGWAQFKDGDRPRNSSADANRNEGWTVMSGLSLTF